MAQVDSALGTAAPPDSVEALGMLSFWRGTAEVRHTLEYIRTSRKTSQPIAVVGFDNQNTAADRNAWTARMAAEFGVPATLNTQLTLQYRAFRMNAAALDSLAETLHAIGRFADAGLARSDSPPRRLQRRAIDDALVQVRHFREAIARGRPFQARDNNPRDQRMADNLVWQLEQFPGRRVVAWMATLHAVYAPAGVRDSLGNVQLDGFVSTGQLVRERLGSAVYTIAFTAAEGSFGSVYDTVAHPIPGLPAGSMEQFLAATGHPATFLDLRTLPADHPLARPRPSILLGYEVSTARWAEQIDGVFLVRSMTPVTRVR
jgi:erythromycin esterase-like protein